MTVGGQHKVFAAKGADQQQQAGAGEVEVGEHGAGFQKGNAGIEKDGGFAFEFSGTGGGLQRSDAGGADGYHALRGIDGAGVGRRDRVVLGVQLRLLDYFFVQRLKGAQAHMEGDERLFGAGVAAAGQHFGGEVKSGGGRGYGASFAGEDRLVAIAVGGRIGALDRSEERRVGKEGRS